MKMLHSKYVLMLIIFSLSSASLSFSQSLSEKRQKDYQAVRNLIFSNTKTAETQQSNLNSEKPKSKEAGIENYSFNKTAVGIDRRKSYYMNGNNITTDIYNYGGIGPGYGLLRGVNNFVWNKLDYVFQFCPIVGAQVPNANDTTQLLKIISDGLWDYPQQQLREVSPDGTVLWQWQPLEGYSDPNSDDMASNPADDLDGDGKPDSWPRDWYNSTLGKYVWPGYLSQDATNADLEVFWAMDDRENFEFPYYPYVNDSSKKGIGIQVDGRAFQWSNALAGNTIFFVYTITNVSDKDLDTVLFGIYGDPDLGGGSPENTDDNGFFIPPYSTPQVNVDNIPVYARSMVYFWDPDMVGRGGLPLGYLGCKFLESPGNAVNGIDDDGDGMIDESQEDGIDNDGDWNPLINDTGIDGIPNTGDEGEGDGVPTAGKRLPNGALDPLYPGEKNFELTDLDEADQIGLTSFNSWAWAQDRISDDNSMWNRSKPRNFGDIQQSSDIVFIFGSGYISLKKGETKRISMALLCGENLQDLLISAETVQTIYNQNYQFFKPPVLPSVYAVPGDKKVTLYWDTKAEESVDPISGKDFEGYVIYRSIDPSFQDIKIITDGKGSSFLSQPLNDINGFEAKWDVGIRDEPFTDLNNNTRYDAGEPFVDYNNDGVWSQNVEDPWKGYHPIAYQGRGIQYYLGNNSGLVHSFIDSNNVINGQTYYYAVVAYDHGDSVGIPPTETTKKITLDPITSQLRFDINTVQVIPGPRASGYSPPQFSDLGLNHEEGIGTGAVTINIMNDLAIAQDAEYQIMFEDSLIVPSGKILQKNYSVIHLLPITESFIVYDTKFTKLDNSNIYVDSVVVKDAATGTVFTKDIDYILDYEKGSIRRTDGSSMQSGSTYQITYRYYPIYQSNKLDYEDDNPVFDGMQLRLNDDPILELDNDRTKWIEGNTNMQIQVQKGSRTGSKLWPADYEIRFSSQNIDTALIQITGGVRSFPVKYSVKEVTTNVPTPIYTFLVENPGTKDSAWSPGEEIILFKPGSPGLPSDFTWGVTIFNPDTPQVPIVPKDGDVLLIKTKRPFLNVDKFSFKTEAASFEQEAAKSGLENVYAVPNPYIGVNEIEPTNKLPGQSRGERRIYFENLPPKCTIRIFTLSGEHVQTIEHESTLQNGREFWNLLNKDGFSIAYGIYFAHIDAEGVGEKLIKLAIIK